METLETLKEEMKISEAWREATFTKFKQEFPNFFRNMRLDGFWLEKGWVKLFASACAYVEDQCEEFYLVQVKEKFGELTINFRTENDKPLDVIYIKGRFVGNMFKLYFFLSSFENVSLTICQFCGNIGAKSKNFSGRVATLCPSCTKDYVKKGNPIAE
jgi:hypothetical protein